MGLIYFVLQGLVKTGMVKDAQLGAAISVPLVLLGVWWAIRRIKKGMLG